MTSPPHNADVSFPCLLATDGPLPYGVVHQHTRDGQNERELLSDPFSDMNSILNHLNIATWIDSAAPRSHRTRHPVKQNRSQPNSIPQSGFSVRA
jgi:hypothetical protein